MKKENSLIVREKENVFSRVFKWIRNIFVKKEKNISIQKEETVISEFPNITIPKAVQMPASTEEIPLDKNSLEYLYELSDEELELINQQYDEQMEEAKNEILRLENILQTYKQSIQKMQENLANNET